MQRMKPLALRFTIALVIVSIGFITAGFWFSQSSVPKKCTDADYFPKGVLSRVGGRGEWLGKIYSAQMESPFSCLDEDVEAYRLLFLPSFEPPASIRIWKSGDEMHIAVKRLSTTGMLPNGAEDLKVNVSRPLADKEWNHFQELLKKSNFWSMPSEDVKEKGLDGATLLLEGKRRAQYHVVDRWFPEDQNFLDACGYLMDISRLEWQQ